MTIKAEAKERAVERHRLDITFLTCKKRVIDRFSTGENRTAFTAPGDEK